MEDKNIDKEQPKKKRFDLMDDLKNGGAIELVPDPNPEDVKPEKRGPGRPRKKKLEEGPSNRENKTPLNSDMSYLDTYQFPASLIGGTISELNALSARLNQDLNYVRASRTMKSKYIYISNLSGALTSVLSSKVQAIRELRGMVTDANNFELKRQQQLKINEKESDDKIISDMYNAYLNAPVGTLSSRPINVSPEFLNSGGNGYGTPMITADGQSYAVADDSQFQNYINNLTPQQNQMINEKNVEIVLVYNQTDQSRRFEAIDNRTGMPVPNIELPNDFVRDGCVIDIRKGIARNSSLNQTFKLRLEGSGAINDF